MDIVKIVENQRAYFNSRQTFDANKIKRGIINSSLAINTAILARIPEEIINAAKKYASC